MSEQSASKSKVGERGFQYEANRLRARSDLYQKLAHIESMLWWTKQSDNEFSMTIGINGNSLLVTSVQHKPVELVEAFAEEFEREISRIKQILDTKEFP
jgi:hypothetical protein